MIWFVILHYVCHEINLIYFTLHSQAIDDRSPGSGQQMGEEHGEGKQTVGDKVDRPGLHEDLGELYHLW